MQHSGKILENMAERLGLGGEIRELKLGPTFTNDRSTAFHTVKYDFKPASVEVSKMALVDVGSNNTMTVTVPHLDGKGSSTIFKGSQKPYHKECVLIIDRTTGEITLEKLSSNIQVKKTRSEARAQSSSMAPNSNTVNKPVEAPLEFRTSPTNGRTSSRTKVVSGKKKEPSFQLPSKQLSPIEAFPSYGKSPTDIVNSLGAQHGSALASLPMIGMDSEDFSSLTVQPPPRFISSQRTSPPVENNEQKPIPKTENNMAALSDSTSSSSSSDSSDSDDAESMPVPKQTNECSSTKTTSRPTGLHEDLLNDDLQLSESESDSD